MDIILLGITVVSLGVALVMSVAAWRLTSDEKKRSAARVAALSVAAGEDKPKGLSPQVGEDRPEGLWPQEPLGVSPPPVVNERPVAKAPWAAPKVIPAPLATSVAPAELPLNQPRVEPVRIAEPSISHASGFLGAAELERDNGSRQRSLAFAAIALFVVLSGGLVWMILGPRGTTAAAMGPNSPLELVSLSHERHNQKLAVSGLVRNPAAGTPVEHLSAVVFLFDRMGTFIASSRANVDFLKLGAGDETPFVVTLDAPATVARYRVSFRTDEGIVPHIDRRAETQTAAPGEQPLNVSAK
jgi:hypothetical protein